MRDDSSITDQVQQAMLDVEELKAAQLVGESQIKIKEYVSDEVTVTSDGPDLVVEAFAWLDVVASTVADPNVLIVYCVPEVRNNGNLIDNKTDGWEFNLTNIEVPESNHVAYQANIYRTSTGGSNVPVTTYTVKFHVWSAADVTLTAGSGYYVQS